MIKKIVFLSFLLTIPINSIQALFSTPSIQPTTGHWSKALPFIVGSGIGTLLFIKMWELTYSRDNKEYRFLAGGASIGTAFITTICLDKIGPAALFLPIVVGVSATSLVFHYDLKINTIEGPFWGTMIGMASLIGGLATHETANGFTSLYKWATKS